MRIIYNIGVNILGQACFATHEIIESRVQFPDKRGTGNSSLVAESTPDHTLNQITRKDRMVFYDGVIEN